MENKKLLLAFYGDDFTGSTDALEMLTNQGFRTVLFLNTPTPDDLIAYGNPDAAGIAGISRSLAPKEMIEELEPVFTSLRKLNPLHLHYKVCSTFDSSPQTGNIGIAIETGQRILNTQFTPILVAHPLLGRYSSFGNLYARMGIGSNGKIYRLDRHPSMSKHPVTPAKESDLRLHLSKQTELNIDLIDLTVISQGSRSILRNLKEKESEGQNIVFLDAVYETDMPVIGEALDSYAREKELLFTVGSSGIEYALSNFWKKNKFPGNTGNFSGSIHSTKQISSKGDKRNPVLILSGSVSPVTSAQIGFAEMNGIEILDLDPACLLPGGEKMIYKIYLPEILNRLKSGISLLVNTCRGPDDHRYDILFSMLKSVNSDVTQHSVYTINEISNHIGKTLGIIAREVVAEFPLHYLGIAGGDTSGNILRSMDLDALEMTHRFSPGAPICKVLAKGRSADGILINLKGGQVGNENYFVELIKKFREANADDQID